MGNNFMLSLSRRDDLDLAQKQPSYSGAESLRQTLDLIALAYRFTEARPPGVPGYLLVGIE
jgi:hypothetical protein